MPRSSPYRAPRRWLRLAGTELASLVILALAAGALYGFVELAGDVRDGELHDLDRQLLLALRDPADLSDPIGPGWFEEMARDFTALGGLGVLALLTFAAVGYLLTIARYASALLVALAVGTGVLASTLLKELFGRARPDLVPHATEVYTASFPSGHAMLSAVTYLTLGALLMRLQPRLHAKAYVLVVALLLTLLVGASRVYLGVHWPSDVLAGWCIGAFWAIGCWLIALALQHRRRVEPDEAVIEAETADAADAANAAGIAPARRPDGSQPRAT